MENEMGQGMMGEQERGAEDVDWQELAGIPPSCTKSQSLIGLIITT